MQNIQINAITSSYDDRTCYYYEDRVRVNINETLHEPTVQEFFEQYSNINACSLCLGNFIKRVVSLLYASDEILTINRYRFIETSYETMFQSWRTCTGPHVTKYCPLCFIMFIRFIDDIFTNWAVAYYADFSDDVNIFFSDQFTMWEHCIGGLHADLPQLVRRNN